MWRTPSGNTIADDEQYIGQVGDNAGTRYPANFPKSQIKELLPVQMSAQPSTTQYQTVASKIESVGGQWRQVWAVTDWTTEQIASHKKSLVPNVVTMRQARLALHGAGHLESVSALVDKAGPEARIEWEYSQEVRRDRGLVLSIAGALGLTEEELDSLFIAAAAIT